jgi:Xaa-Pro aminopeptidase
VPSPANRIDRLREALDASALDGLLVGSAANRRYLSGFSGSAGWALVTSDDARLSTDSRYWEQAAHQSPDFHLHEQEPGLANWLPGLLAGLGGKKIGFEAEHLSVATHKQMRDTIAKMPAPQRPALLQSDAIVERMRATKEAGEIDAIQRAVALGDAAFEAIAARMEPGWSETRVAWEIERYAREHGAEAMSFDTIVGGGPWGAQPHAYPRDEPVQANVPIVIDMGVVVDGYCSDMTRTIVVGQPDEQFTKLYDIVLAAQEIAQETLEAGMSGKEVHALAHTVITEAGYGEQFGHGLGHGVGVEVHELPRIGTTSEDILQDGMVLTVEPGIYVPGWGGIRLEDMGVIEDGKFRNFTTATKLRCIA